MQLLPRPYSRLVLRLHTDELIAAGLSRRRAKIAALLWLLQRSLKMNDRRS
jgi:hypothetical protein